MSGRSLGSKLSKLLYSPFFWLGLSVIWYLALYLPLFLWGGSGCLIKTPWAHFPPLFFVLVSILGMVKKYSGQGLLIAFLMVATVLIGFAEIHNKYDLDLFSWSSSKGANFANMVPDPCCKDCVG